MQYRGASRARRVLAVVTGLWLVVFGVLGAQHESRVAHFVDAQTGLVFHATAMIGHHTGHQSDVHGCDEIPEHDACTISSTLHQATSPAVARAHVVGAPEVPLVYATPPARAANASQLVYRFAPKTSPPVAADRALIRARVHRACVTRSRRGRIRDRPESARARFVLDAIASCSGLEESP